MTLNAVDAFNSDAIAINMENLAGYSLVLSGDNKHVIVFLNLRHGLEHLRSE
jgi:hypothetical protein